MRSFYLFIGCIALAHCVGASDHVRVEAALEEQSIFMGESVLYQVSVIHGDEADRPNLSALEKDFTVVPTGQTARHENINRHRTSRIIFQYQLTPKRSGQLEIQGPQVTTAGTTYSGNLITLLVKELEKQDWVILETVIRPAHIFPGQPFKVCARILMRAAAGLDKESLKHLRTPSLTVPWLTQAPDDLKPQQAVKDVIGGMLQRKGFALLGFTRRVGFFEEGQAVVLPQAVKEKRNGLDGAEHEYFVYEISMEYVSDKPAKLSLGSLIFRGPIITALVGRTYQTRDLYVVAPPATLDIIDPAVLGATPADFTGAVGRITLLADAQPKALRVGDPLTLQLDVTAAGASNALNLVGPPDLSLLQDFERDFVMVDAKPTGETVGSVKRFQYSLRPKRPGVHLPPITCSYFDAVTEGFQQATSNGVKLEVREAVKLSHAEVIANVRPAPSTSDLRSLEGGIHQNMTDLSELQDVQVGSLGYAAWPAILWFVYAALSLLVSRRRRWNGDRAYRRRQSALPTLRAQLHAADSGLKGAARIRAALLGLVADLHNLSAAGMTPRDAAQTLQAGGVSTGLQQELNAILDTCEAAAFGGTAADAATLCAQARDLAERLERECKP